MVLDLLETRCLYAFACMPSELFEGPFLACLENVDVPMAHDLCCNFAIESGTWANVTALSQGFQSYAQQPCCPTSSPSICALLKEFPGYHLCDLLMELNPVVRGLLLKIDAFIKSEENALKNNELLDPFIQRFIRRTLN